MTVPFRFINCWHTSNFVHFGYFNSAWVTNFKPETNSHSFWPNFPVKIFANHGLVRVRFAIFDLLSGKLAWIWWLLVPTLVWIKTVNSGKCLCVCSFDIPVYELGKCCGPIRSFKIRVLIWSTVNKTDDTISELINSPKEC